MEEQKKDEIRQEVRKRYTDIAKSDSARCGCSPSCCTPQDLSIKDLSAKLGYTSQEINSVPDGANMGVGCGNPQAIAMLKEGETVLDIGSGGGFDCFLAAKQVRDKGHVIGVDMTPDMISKARENAQKGNYTNVEFRLGEIEYLPVADNAVDVIISNCVINLSPDKSQVFREAYRVLKPGGRLAISDVVAIQELPEVMRNDVEKYTGCIAGAATIDELKAILEQVGFVNIKILINEESKNFIKDWFPGSGAEKFVASAFIQTQK
jgi:ubiquinone/menaquinone biosynthesis C-methylase UbiE